MNTLPAMVSSRLLLFSPAIFMLITEAVGQPASLNSSCSSRESVCAANRTSDACFQYLLLCSNLSSYSNGSPRVHSRTSHLNGLKPNDNILKSARFSQIGDRPTPIKKLSQTHAAAVPGIVSGTMPGEGKEELLTMRSPISTVPSQQRNKDRGPFWFACFAFRTNSNMGSQQKFSQATGTTQCSSKLQEALDKFDTESNGSQPSPHFYCFDGYLEKFLRFTIPTEGVPLLKKFRNSYGDFTAGCRLGNMAGSMLLTLLSTVLLDIRSMP